MAVIALVVGACLDAPYADVSAGPTPDLTKAIAAANSGNDALRDDWGHGGRWLATTINARGLTWAQWAQCRIRDNCDLFPLDTSSGAAADAAEAMQRAEATAAQMAAPWAATTSPDVTLTADLGQVGGASAGGMLTLAFIDATNTGDLTGGKVIAGTGTINDLNEFGPIAGVKFKVAGAIAAGADVFIVPTYEADDAQEAAEGTDLQIVPVYSVLDALAWLCQNGATSSVCTSPNLALAAD